MMVLAVFCLNIGHPGFAFGSEKHATPGLTYTASGENLEMKKPSSSSE
jgi:hypothetical protein